MEHENQILDQYLHCLINYHQNDWVWLLPFAKFAYNISGGRLTHQSPFYTSYGFHSQFHLSIPQVSHVPIASNLVEHLHCIQEELKAHLELSKQDFKWYATLHWQGTCYITVVDKVWLSMLTLSLPDLHESWITDMLAHLADQSQ